MVFEFHTWKKKKKIQYKLNNKIRLIKIFLKKYNEVIKYLHGIK